MNNFLSIAAEIKNIVSGRVTKMERFIFNAFTPRCLLSAGAVVMLVCGVVSFPAMASESGLNDYPNGVNTFMSAVVPPPGATQYYQYNLYINSHAFNGNNGESEIPGFRLRLFVTASRFLHGWTTFDTPIGSVELLSYVVLPFISNSIRVPGATGSPTNFHSSRLGDPTFVPIYLSWHKDNIWVVWGPNIWLPIGYYSKTDPSSTGQNHWDIASELGVTWMPFGNVSMGLHTMTEFNTTNPATRYRNGNDTDVDFDINYAPSMFNHQIWAGVQGYYFQQWTSDTQNGHVVEGARGQQIAIGPDIVWSPRPGYGIIFQWQHTLRARNRADEDEFWINWTLPL